MLIVSRGSVSSELYLSNPTCQVSKATLGKRSLPIVSRSRWTRATGSHHLLLPSCSDASAVRWSLSTITLMADFPAAILNPDRKTWDPCRPSYDKRRRRLGLPMMATETEQYS